MILARADDRVRKQRKAINKAKLRALQGREDAMRKIGNRQFQIIPIHHSETLQGLKRLSGLFCKVVQFTQYAAILHQQYIELYTVHGKCTFIYALLL